MWCIAASSQAADGLPKHPLAWRVFSAVDQLACQVQSSAQRRQFTRSRPHVTPGVCNRIVWLIRIVDAVNGGLLGRSQHPPRTRHIPSLRSPASTPKKCDEAARESVGSTRCPSDAFSERSAQ